MIGINCPESDKRTTPTATNRQEIGIYVCFSEGIYLYNANEHSLVLTAKGNFYPLISFEARFCPSGYYYFALGCRYFQFWRNNNEQKMLIGALDAGIVSQNISIFCTGTNMETVPRAWIGSETLKKRIKFEKYAIFDVESFGGVRNSKN